MTDRRFRAVKAAADALREAGYHDDATSIARILCPPSRDANETDRLAERERLLKMGAPAHADYTLSLEARIHQLETENAQRRDPPGCPFPLHQEKYGLSHRNYVAVIGDTADDPLSGFNVVECEACGNITLERPIALA